MPLQQYAISEIDLVAFKKRRYVRQLTTAAIKKGELVRPSICELCDEAHHDIDAHHIDYGRPFDVIWLCSSCHGLAHSTDHALNPSNNAQSPLPIVCDKYNNVTVSFSMPIKNFLAMKSESLRQNASISEIMRAEAIKKFPVLAEQLEFTFIKGEKDNAEKTRASHIETPRVYNLETDAGSLPKQKPQILQAFRRHRGDDLFGMDEVSEFFG